ncbi:hypothetical protein PSPO01_03557 [Paraphaeosphaeria sporulosa]
MRRSFSHPGVPSTTLDGQGRGLRAEKTTVVSRAACANGVADGLIGSSSGEVRGVEMEMHRALGRTTPRRKGHLYCGPPGAPRNKKQRRGDCRTAYVGAEAAAHSASMKSKQRERSLDAKRASSVLQVMRRKSVGSGFGVGV